MRVLEMSLGIWFDTFEELEVGLGLDLRKSLADAKASHILVENTQNV